MNEARFDEMALGTFREVAGSMRWVGIFWIALAVLVLAMVGLGLVVGVATGKLATGETVRGVLNAINQVTMIAAGAYTLRTAAALREVIAGASDPIGAMMVTLGHLRRLFTWYAATIALYVVTDVLTLAGVGS